MCNHQRRESRYRRLWERMDGIPCNNPRCFLREGWVRSFGRWVNSLTRFTIFLSVPDCCPCNLVNDSTHPILIKTITKAREDNMFENVKRGCNILMYNSQFLIPCERNGKRIDLVFIIFNGARSWKIRDTNQTIRTSANIR